MKIHMGLISLHKKSKKWSVSCLCASEIGCVDELNNVL